MHFKDARAWIGKVGALFIFSQISVIMLLPTAKADLTLIGIEVAILSAVLGMDILNSKMQAKLKTTHSLLGVLVTEEQNDDDT